jgi:hypothetical protein
MQMKASTSVMLSYITTMAINNATNNLTVFSYLQRSDSGFTLPVITLYRYDESVSISNAFLK